MADNENSSSGDAQHPEAELEFYTDTVDVRVLFALQRDAWYMTSPEIA